MQKNNYQLGSSNFLQDPYPVLAQLAKHDPVYWSNELNAWILTRYDDVLSAFQDQRFSADRVAVVNDRSTQMPEPQLPQIKNFMRVLSGMLFVKDGEAHRRLRKPLNQALRSELVDRFNVKIQRAAQDTVKYLAGQSEFDVVIDFASVYSLLVLCQLLGVPTDDQDLIRQWTIDYAAFLGAPKDAATAQTVGVAADNAVCSFEEYFASIMRKPESELQPGLIKEFIAKSKATGLSSPEMISQFIMLTTAGNAPVVDQLSNTLLNIMQHTALYQELRARPDLIEKATIEGLRFDAATFIAHRYANTDITLSGSTIHKGDVVFLAIGAANRDLSVFIDAQCFDIHRQNNAKHLTFGAGIHHCFGSKLAITILNAGLKALVCDLPLLESSAPAIARYDTFAFRGYKRLPVKINKHHNHLSLRAG